MIYKIFVQFIYTHINKLVRELSAILCEKLYFGINESNSLLRNELVKKNNLLTATNNEQIFRSISPKTSCPEEVLEFS